MPTTAPAAVDDHDLGVLDNIWNRADRTGGRCKGHGGGRARKCGDGGGGECRATDETKNCPAIQQCHRATPIENPMSWKGQSRLQVALVKLGTLAEAILAEESGRGKHLEVA